MPSSRLELPQDPVTRWAIEVEAGRIVAGALVRHAAERHLKDLVDGPARGLFWRPERAQRAIDFFPSCLTITGGALVGQPFVLLPYTMFLTGSIFGWFTPEGLRRFRTAWVETGKGQAKSPWMAAIGLLMMRFMGVPRAEVIAFAETRDQANVLFRDAVSMARAKMPGDEPEDERETLQEASGLRIRGTGDNAWKIEWDGSELGLGMCSFRPIANTNAGSGPKPILVLGDEVHEHKSDQGIEIWAAALAKMPGDPLMILGTNTPAADQIVGTTYSDYYSSVAKGEFEDDASLAFVATTDKGDDPLGEASGAPDETCWRKSLPALGITYEVSKIREEVAKARNLPSKALTVKRLFFGIRVGVAQCWIDQPAWEEVLDDFSPEELVGLPCWPSLDLSSRTDFTAHGQTWVDVENRMGRGEGHIFFDCKYFTPAATLYARAKEDKAPYPAWVEAGHLVAVPGPVIGKDFVAADVKQTVADHEVEYLVFDNAQMLDFENEARAIGLDTWRYEGPDALEGVGLKLVQHSQGFRGMDSPKAHWMPRSVEKTEEVILNRRISIRRNPVTNFCSANMALLADGAGNRAPHRRRSRGRIDGMIALLQGVGAATAAERAGARSYLETHGLVIA